MVKYSAVLLTILICASLVQFSTADGRKRQRKNSSSSDPSFSTVNPEQRSFENWLSLGKEALVLYCNAVNLPSSGSASDLAFSLHEHYRREDLPTSTSLVESPVIQSSSVPASTTLSVSQPVSLFDTTALSTAPIMSTGTLSGAGPTLTETIRQEVASAIANLFSTSQSPLDGLSRQSCPDPLVDLSQQQAIGAPVASNINLPAIPSSILERIRRGEFVNFDLLLPNNVPSETRDTFTMSLNNSESGNGPRIVVQNGSRSAKNKIMDLYSWFIAWSLFFQAYIIFRGHLACQLAKYQIFIAQLASNYNFTAWYSYDQAFRTYIANNPTSRWDALRRFI